MIVAKYILIVAVLFLIGFVYFKTYYIRLNNVIANSKKRLYKISPKNFSIALMVLCISILLPLSIVEVKALSNQVNTLEEIIIKDPFIEGGFPNVAMEVTYKNYNNYFGGIYIKDGEYILCITYDSPNSLVEYLESYGINVQFVNHNYSDLMQLRYIIVKDSLEAEDNYFGFEGIDTRNNCVVLGVTKEDFDSTKYQNYLDLNMLKIEFTGNADFYPLIINWKQLIAYWISLTLDSVKKMRP